VVELSHDHKPDLESEKMRILQSNGRVDQMDFNGFKNGPNRVWMRDEEYPGLAMSRSIGDFIASHVGVICDPEVLEFDIVDEMKYIVIGSDGVWEFLSNRRVMDLVNRHYKSGDIENAKEKIIDEATLLWKMNDSCIDDITAIVIFFSKN